MNPSKAKDEDSDDEDDNKDDYRDREDSDDEGDNDSNDDSDGDEDGYRKSHGQSGDSSQPPSNGNSQQRQNFGHNANSSPPSQWNILGQLPNHILQLGLYFQSILDKRLQDRAKSSGVLSFRDVARIVQHTFVHRSNTLSAMLGPALASLDTVSVFMSQYLRDNSDQLVSSTEPSPRNELAVAFWLLPHSRFLDYAAISTMDICRFEKLGVGAASYVEKIKIRGHTQALARKFSRESPLYHRFGLLQEFPLLSRVNHHHVTQCVRFLMEKSSCSLVMTPVADFTSHDLLRGDRLLRRSGPLKQSLGCLASALDAVHQENIRHLDIKPANIFVLDSRVGNYQGLLTDFGISLNGSNLAAALYGPRGMTPLYAAPEVHTGGERSSPA